MQVQINTDNHLKNSVDFSEGLKASLEKSFQKYREHITRAEVYLSDANSEKGGELDKQCSIEIRLEGRRPFATSHKAATLLEAFKGARDKAKRVIRDTLEKQRSH